MNKSWILAFALGLGLVAGCDSNPTNEPSKDAIEKANADRTAAIDNDATLSPEQKAKMKEMMGLTGKRPTPNAPTSK